MVPLASFPIRREGAKRSAYPEGCQGPTGTGAHAQGASPCRVCTARIFRCQRWKRWEQRLLDVLSPSLLAPRQLERRDPRQPHRLIRMRQRLLTLPVIVAIMVSLVWRRVPSIAEVQKVLAREGLLGMAPLQVSPQAITKRLAVLPAV